MIRYIAQLSPHHRNLSRRVHLFMDVAGQVNEKRCGLTRLYFLQNELQKEQQPDDAGK
ncbi:hypothetical protein [Escherichia fergusonii]|uniref:Uncharacterized protein n=1 Tax=Escherichia fergusonii (strain ATCC 35469 / DSM 13698 / CCUG 18766 / IAM 14443 / JCM 21226 / LMG 7866 / NBRC 102419 / NCTC 12128 / CDC 0568-73) TaxID=585054 RepID=B7LSZ2_ESCF3|nr:hypothetical protein [Escherichia fergusonii]CAQ90981.1 hypothetical protein EFER_3504 [Escherichia fergusonii ATCC 35469]MBA8265406.1 hypothetical protein [Escherichia fergusonii]MBZ4080922.1 hypothetical protein [Escherichia fergusonii]MBZ4132231.1 hypothetical protein [Escherichia fergusonii]MCP9696737.1 hypothetical protein [Escherichia fergusonii]